MKCHYTVLPQDGDETKAKMIFFFFSIFLQKSGISKRKYEQTPSFPFLIVCLKSPR